FQCRSARGHQESGLHLAAEVGVIRMRGVANRKMGVIGGDDTKIAKSHLQVDFRARVYIPVLRPGFGIFVVSIAERNGEEKNYNPSSQHRRPPQTKRTNRAHRRVEYCTPVKPASGFTLPWGLRAASGQNLTLTP